MSDDLSDNSPEVSKGRWALAIEGDAAGRAEVFKELAASYWYCVYAWWRRAGLDAADTAKATAACLGRWQHVAPPSVSDSGAPRMREWMAARLGELARAEAELEVIEPTAVTIDTEWAEKRYADEPAGEAVAIFERRWALTMIEFTAATLHAEYAARDEEALFNELLAFAGFGSGNEDQYSAAAARLKRSSGAMHKAVFDFRTRQREVLRSYAADTLLNAEEANEEITALLCALSAPGPESESAPLPSEIRQVRPDEMLARAMQTVQMTKAGPGGWKPPTLAEVARIFPQYEMISLVGRGGMGAVYKAREPELDRFVAVKLLPLEVSVQRDFAQRFRREAQTMAKLNHPNIIAVHDIGTTSEGHLFFVMDFIDGANLQQMIRGKRLAPLHALAIVGGICDALAYAHSKGVVHRDIKPANVMVNVEGHAKVADFGLARLTDPTAEQTTGHTVTGTVMGTTEYMAPEQMYGSDVDHRADIYSLGVTLYEMLCGEVPRGIFAPPSTRIQGVDARVDLVVTKAMQQQPERRYQSTSEMKSDISIATSKLLARPARTSTPTPAPEMRPKQSKAPLWFGLAVLLAAAGIGAHYLIGQKNSGEPTTKAGVAEQEAKPEAAEPKKPEENTTSESAASTPAASDKPAAVENTGAAKPAPNDAPAVNEPPSDPVVSTQAATPPTEDKAQPAPATPAPKSEIANWLDQVDAQYRGPYLEQVVKPYQDGVAKLDQTTIAKLDFQLGAATKAGKLEDAVALRAERQRLAEGNGIPVEDPEKPRPIVKKLRDDYRAQAQFLERTRTQGAKARFEPYDKVLADAQAQLTQRQRLDEALLVKARREQIAGEWLEQSVSFSAASKEAPLVNSLGLKFVPVPILGGPTDGQRVLFSIWSTRVQDYQVFVNETKREWPGPGFEQGPTHPAVRVTWEDAAAFCTWLTERERKAGKLGAQECYRLPSDHEWSCAAGLGSREDAARMPAEKSGKIDDFFPWGSGWPPPQGAGNFAGEEYQPILDAKKSPFGKNQTSVISGYKDGFMYTSPVGAFTPNRLGLYDLEGDAWQWCTDWFNHDQKDRTLRGSSWAFDARQALLLSRRGHYPPDYRGVGGGFRCVLGAPLPPSPATTFTAASTAAPAPPVGVWVDLLAQLTPAGVEQTAQGWRLQNGVLHRTDDLVANLRFRTVQFPVNFSGVSYAVRLKVRRLAPMDCLHVTLPVGNQMTSFELEGYGAKYTGLNRAGGKFGENLPGIVQGLQVHDSEAHDLELFVRLEGANAVISAALDGKPIYQWTGPIAVLSENSIWQNQPGLIGIGAVTATWEVTTVQAERLEK